MKTKELTKKLEELEYSWDTYDYYNNTYIDIYGIGDGEHHDEELATVCVSKQYILNTNYDLFEEMSKEDRKELYELLDEYSSTPEDEREDKNQKYTYKHERLKTKGGNWSYLAIRQRPSISYPILQGSDVDIHEYKVEFTDEEIEEYKKEFGINLDHYIKEEARQENL
nr:MAG TPA_asm: hypothetical protein [Caudoviricetes sp.]